MSLVKVVKNDIDQFLKANTELFYNERDFQVHLALFLSKKKDNYDDVDVEYYVPYKIFGDDYIWKNELKIDVVVSKNGEYCPIELKYKTKAEKNEPSLKRFGTDIDAILPKGTDDFRILKNQAAQDLGMYNFWKDVRRVELVKEKFDDVKSGICVFLTNDTVYINSGKNSASNNYFMSMSGGVHNRQRKWNDPNSACANDNPDFVLNAKYNIVWDKIVVSDIDFHYVILEV